jgi:hypothetical protein
LHAAQSTAEQGAVHGPVGCSSHQIGVDCWKSISMQSPNRHLTL